MKTDKDICEAAKQLPSPLFFPREFIEITKANPLPLSMALIRSVESKRFTFKRVAFESASGKYRRRYRWQSEDNPNLFFGKGGETIP